MRVLKESTPELRKLWDNLNEWLSVHAVEWNSLSPNIQLGFMEKSYAALWEQAQQGEFPQTVTPTCCYVWDLFISPINIIEQMEFVPEKYRTVPPPTHSW